MADWSQLPSELLQQISQKLNYSELYLLRFRSVCSSWRRSSSSSSLPKCHHNHLPSKLPHFADQIKYLLRLYKHQNLNVNVTIMEPHPSWKRSCGPYCNHNHSPTEIPQFPDPCDRRLFKQNIFLIKPPATLTTHHNSPWLIRIGPDVYGKPQIWNPFDVHLGYPLFFAPCHFVHHLIDFNQLPVIDIGHMFYIYGPSFHIGKVVVANCEMGQPHSILTYDRSDVPKIFKCEENSWMNIPTMPKSRWGDICLFKGRPCVADKDGRTLMIRPEDSSVLLLANPVFGGHVKFLVEGQCDSLLLVDSHGIDTGADDKDMKFDVFKLDEKEKKWIKLTTLGDRVLFLDRECSFSASASDLHVGNGNCIIYSRNAKFRNINAIHSGMRIYHLDQGRVSRLSDNPDYIKLFWPPPKWILKLHNQTRAMKFDVSEVRESYNEVTNDYGVDIGSGGDDDHNDEEDFFSEWHEEEDDDDNNDEDEDDDDDDDDDDNDEEDEDED